MSLYRTQSGLSRGKVGSHVRSDMDLRRPLRVEPTPRSFKRELLELVGPEGWKQKGSTFMRALLLLLAVHAAFLLGVLSYRHWPHSP
jgi:hypothetical protein